MTLLVLALGTLSLAQAPQPTPLGTLPPPGTVVPPADTTLRHLNACAGSPLQAFLRLPSARPIGLCVSATSDAACAHAGWVYEFPRAAHFPLPRYTQAGEFDARDGLLIYEGMRLTVNETTGAYDLEFTATVPSTPVTVHLQLVFKPRGVAAEPFRLTLPPIRLEPPTRAALGDPTANSFLVNHRGYYPLFLTNAVSTTQIPLKIDATTCEIVRVGSARFGTPVAVDDLGR